MKRKIIKISFIIFWALIMLIPQAKLAKETEEFTVEEKEYINSHSKIYIAGNANLNPIESYNSKKNKYIGIVPSIFEKITEISGIEFEYINKDESWQNYVIENQVEIVSGVLEETDIEQLNLKEKLQVVKVPIEKEYKTIYIAFTQISDETLINIMKKSINKLELMDVQEIMTKELINSNKDNIEEYILLGIRIAILTIGIVLFILYKKYKKEAKQSKYIDHITKRGNYKNMEIDFNNMITDENRVSYCVINLGIEIKHIEEIYGYSEVGEILKYVSDVIGGYVKNNESYARIYKDSFVILANLALEENIVERISNIIDETKQFSLKNNKPYKVEAYAGIYYLKVTDKNLSQSVYNAMKAREEAKEQGKIIKRCTEALILKTNKNKKLEGHIVKAFENEEFKTYLQPLISLKDNNIVAIEALARWESQQMGLVKPSTFISILQNNNIVDKLDFLMYENTCKMLSKIIEKGQEPVNVFCNFSKETIEKRNFVEKVTRIKEKYELPEKYIGIIISEGNEKIKNVIENLRKEGFSVLLNNFGATRYSFNDIKELQIDYLKISSTLTEDLSDNRTVSITKGIIDMAHSLNVKVICEDFETKEKEQILKQIDCDIVQGKAYYPPIPMEELTQIIQNMVKK